MSKLRISQDLIDLFYPVGTYYETSNLDFNPNNEWGGTWKEDTAGRVTVAYDSSQSEFNTVGKTLGSKYLQSHTHSGSIGYDGNHSHSYDRYAYQAQGTNWGTLNNSNWGDKCWGNTAYTSTTGNHNHSLTINNTGDGNEGNIQPSIVVKRWHRTA